MSGVRVVDAREACCMDTLAQPIEQALAEINADQLVEVVVRPSFARMVRLFAQDKGLTILGETGGEDELRFMMRLGEERQRANCMLCGTPLVYLMEAETVTCIYCGAVGRAYSHCPQGHYVCDTCHGKGAYEAVRDIALSSHSTDPLALADEMMAHPAIPMLGCENALASGAAFITALRNKGYAHIGEKEVLEVMERTQRQSISAYCGLTGVCGVAISVGAVFSVLLGAECPKDRETAITMHAAARVMEAIANDTGPCCCKSYVWTGLVVGYNLAKEYLEVKLPIHRESVVCSYFRKHPHGCQGARCTYFPKRGKA